MAFPGLHLSAGDKQSPSTETHSFASLTRSRLEPPSTDLNVSAGLHCRAIGIQPFTPEKLHRDQLVYFQLFQLENTLALKLP